MTPFEKAGYTKDSKFRVMRDTFHFAKGDTVWLYKDDGTTTPMFTDGKNKEWFLLPDEIDYNYTKLELIVEDEPIYPNPPQKHKDVIIEWAKGAEIEYRHKSDEWCSVRTPVWRSGIQYRVKPQTSDKEARINETYIKETYIKELEAELLGARAALEKSEKEFKQYRARVEKALESFDLYP